MTDRPTDRDSAAQGRGAPGEGLRRATGRGRDEWFGLLDAWGAAGRSYRTIADWLTGEHGVSVWWTQKLIVEYQQARGLRPPGVRPDGTFEVLVSRTMAARVERVFDAFVEADFRERWLPGTVPQLRTSQPARSARFDWDGGATRVRVTFAALGEERSRVGVRHERLPDAATAEQAKAYWQAQLEVLRTVLQGGGEGG